MSAGLNLCCSIYTQIRPGTWRISGHIFDPVVLLIPTRSCLMACRYIQRSLLRGEKLEPGAEMVSALQVWSRGWGLNGLNGGKGDTGAEGPGDADSERGQESGPWM